MTNSTQPNSYLRPLGAVLVACGTLFLIYAIYAISRVPPGDGSGFQWLGVIPLGAIFVVFFLPALLLVVIGRLLWLAAFLGMAGLVAFGVVWVQLLAEFPKL